MFGHAIAELARRGIDVPEELSAKAARALLFFVKHRLDSSTGLVTLVHPWESGADNSPRWDGYYATPFGEAGWQEEKLACWIQFSVIRMEHRCTILPLMWLQYLFRLW